MDRCQRRQLARDCRRSLPCVLDMVDPFGKPLGRCRKACTCQQARKRRIAFKIAGHGAQRCRTARLERLGEIELGHSGIAIDQAAEDGYEPLDRRGSGCGAASRQVRFAGRKHRKGYVEDTCKMYHTARLARENPSAALARSVISPMNPREA